LFSCFAAIALYGSTIVHAADDLPTTTRAHELGRIAERAYYAPREVLRALARLQDPVHPLSREEQALALEISSRASFNADDIRAALEQGKRLEALGKSSGNRSHECLGLLHQAYAYYAMGQIDAAHQRTFQAQRIPASALTTQAHVKMLLTLAQVQDERQQHAAGSRSIAQALRIAGAQHDRKLLFLATRMQAARAIAAGDLALASASVDRMLAFARLSPYPEELVRAKHTEYDFAAAAGMNARAARVMDGIIVLMKELRLEEALGWSLVNYADLQLKSKRFREAADLARQALMLDAVQADGGLARTAHFNHALALIGLGQATAGKREAEQVLGESPERADLLAYLPEYIAALTQAGDIDAALKAAVRYGQLQSEDARQRTREQDDARLRIAKLDGERQLRALEAANERATRILWRAAALAFAFAVIAILWCYRRLRSSKRQLEDAHRQLTVSSNRDFLTGLFNRRYIEGMASGLMPDPADPALQANPARGLVIVIDIDHFKQINDRLGHAVGDQVLKQVAQRLSAQLGTDGFVARWGGEEFLALLPAAQAHALAGIAAALLDAVEGQPVPAGDGAVRATISVGACPLHLSCDGRAASWDEVVRLADDALYMAKRQGRNRACAATGMAPGSLVEVARGSEARRSAILCHQAHFVETT
jgi:diguanylate cyclase (GGDEF)-like protein